MTSGSAEARERDRAKEREIGQSNRSEGNDYNRVVR